MCFAVSADPFYKELASPQEKVHSVNHSSQHLALRGCADWGRLSHIVIQSRLHFGIRVLSPSCLLRMTMTTPLQGSTTTWTPEMHPTEIAKDRQYQTTIRVRSDSDPISTDYVEEENFEVPLWHCAAYALRNCCELACGKG